MCDILHWNFILQRVRSFNHWLFKKIWVNKSKSLTSIITFLQLFLFCLVKWIFIEKICHLILFVYNLMALSKILVFKNFIFDIHVTIFYYRIALFCAHRTNIHLYYRTSYTFFIQKCAKKKMRVVILTKKVFPQFLNFEWWIKFLSSFSS